MKKLTQSQFEALQLIAKDKGFTVCERWIEAGIIAYPYIKYYKSDKSFVGCMEAAHERISFNEALDIMLSPACEITLSDDYEAVIRPNSVTVGCLTISFDKVSEVYEKMVELREDSKKPQNLYF